MTNLSMNMIDNSAGEREWFQQTTTVIATMENFSSQHIQKLWERNPKMNSKLK